MKKIKPLIFALLCALSATFTSCEVWDDAVENSIVDKWTNIDGDYFYTYNFYLDGTYYYETGYILSSGQFVETGFDKGYYTFSNYRKQLTIESDFSNEILLYNAYIYNGVLHIEDTKDQYGNWYYSIYYR